MESKESKPKRTCNWRKVFNLVRSQLALEGFRKAITEEGANRTNHLLHSTGIQQNGRDSTFKSTGGDVLITIPVESRTGSKDIPVGQELPAQHDKGASIKDVASAVNNRSKVWPNCESEGNSLHGKATGEGADINARSEAFIKRKKNDLNTLTSGSPGT